MSSAITQEIELEHMASDRPYWQTRSWVYESVSEKPAIKPTSVRRLIMEIPAPERRSPPTPRQIQEKRDRRIRGVHAEATWELQRMRRIKILSDDLLHELMRRLMGLSVGANSFQYRGVTTPARPSVIWMLTCLLTKPGEPISVASMCKQMYGQPASLRAIRQTVFRVNRVFDRIGCSIVIRCHAAHILMQPKGIERVSITECQSEVETSHAIIQLS